MSGALAHLRIDSGLLLDCHGSAILALPTKRRWGLCSEGDGTGTRVVGLLPTDKPLAIARNDPPPATERLLILREALRTALEELPSGEGEFLLRSVLLLTSPNSMLYWQDYLGITTDEAADRLDDRPTRRTLTPIVAIPVRCGVAAISRLADVASCKAAATGVADFLLLRARRLTEAMYSCQYC
jgi:hypothetical protein